MLSLLDKPLRDYGKFICGPDERSRPIPAMRWDSKVTYVRSIEYLKEIHIVNFNLISSLEDPDENLVSIVLIFRHQNDSSYTYIFKNQDDQTIVG